MSIGRIKFIIQKASRLHLQSILTESGKELPRSQHVDGHTTIHQESSSPTRLCYRGAGRRAYLRLRPWYSEHLVDRISDPFWPIIGALNSYLHAYHMYRAEALLAGVRPRHELEDRVKTLRD